jgi:uncharacterized membrane protein
MAQKTVRRSTSLGSALLQSDAVQRLKDEAMNYAAAKSERMLDSLEDRLVDLPETLEKRGVGGPMTSALTTGAKKLAEGKSPLNAGLSSVATGVKESVKSAVGKIGGGGGGGRPKLTNIIENIDVGVPVNVAYDQWTQFEEFSSFMKGVEGVEQKNETESTWRLRVAFSRRTWTAKVLEQIPDRRIKWTSDGPKGTTKGVVTFHPLADDLTRILVVIEYYPGGVFEKTANLWRAPGRRARLDLKHFRRYLMMQGEQDGGWRGEIRDGEVVAEPDEADGRDDVDDFDESDDESDELTDAQEDGAEESDDVDADLDDEADEVMEGERVR